LAATGFLAAAFAFFTAVFVAGAALFLAAPAGFLAAAVFGAVLRGFRVDEADFSELAAVFLAGVLFRVGKSIHPRKGKVWILVLVDSNHGCARPLFIKTGGQSIQISTHAQLGEQRLGLRH
jgi:hypothetical protein